MYSAAASSSFPSVSFAWAKANFDKTGISPLPWLNDCSSPTPLSWSVSSKFVAMKYLASEPYGSPYFASTLRNSSMARWARSCSVLKTGSLESGSGVSETSARVMAIARPKAASASSACLWRQRTTP